MQEETILELAGRGAVVREAGTILVLVVGIGHDIIIVADGVPVGGEANCRTRADLVIPLDAGSVVVMLLLVLYMLLVDGGGTLDGLGVKIPAIVQDVAEIVADGESVLVIGVERILGVGEVRELAALVADARILPVVVNRRIGKPVGLRVGKVARVRNARTNAVLDVVFLLVAVALVSGLNVMIRNLVAVVAVVDEHGQGKFPITGKPHVGQDGLMVLAEKHERSGNEGGQKRDETEFFHRVPLFANEGMRNRFSHTVPLGVKGDGKLFNFCSGNLQNVKSTTRFPSAPWDVSGKARNRSYCGCFWKSANSPVQSRSPGEHFDGFHPQISSSVHQRCHQRCPRAVRWNQQRDIEGSLFHGHAFGKERLHTRYHGK